MSNSIPAIKPIETVWRGYKFRSRLEARWAVCFERLGLRWEYEPEGFVLPNQSRYLPDFYLPDQDLYVEIKPAFNYTPKHVYLAGKFNSDWRASICADAIHSWDSWSGCYEHQSLTYGFHYYAGPYRASQRGEHIGDIPCTHARSGVLADDQDDHVFESEYNDEQVYDANEVFNRCCNAIQQCTAMFAWIDSLDCYGTLAEIGFAHALGKPIFLGIHQDLYHCLPKSGLPDECKPHNIDYHHDLWFVEKMARKSLKTQSALDAYRYFFSPVVPELKKIQQLPKWLLISGNPHPGEYVIFQGYSDTPHDVGVLSIAAPRPWKTKESVQRIAVKRKGREDGAVIAALAAARSARFEHGEQP
jgi:hypothetical protein